MFSVERCRRRRAIASESDDGILVHVRSARKMRRTTGQHHERGATRVARDAVRWLRRRRRPAYIHFTYAPLVVWCVHGSLHTHSCRHPFTVVVFCANVCTPAFSCEPMRGAIIEAAWRHPSGLINCTGHMRTRARARSGSCYSLWPITASILVRLVICFSERFPSPARLDSNLHPNR